MTYHKNIINKIAPTKKTFKIYFNIIPIYMAYQIYINSYKINDIIGRILSVIVIYIDFIHLIN